jgi:uncharacterized membrane protein YvbJ
MVFCKECGKKINDKAFVCPGCGCKVKRTNECEIESTEPKSKTVAVLLAVFLSFWTFLYTYKRDAGKFWAGLAVCLTLWWLFFIPNVVIWIWTIVVTSSRNREWYEEY